MEPVRSPSPDIAIVIEQINFLSFQEAIGTEPDDFSQRISMQFDLTRVDANDTRNNGPFRSRVILPVEDTEVERIDIRISNNNNNNINVDDQYSPRTGPSTPRPTDNLLRIMQEAMQECSKGYEQSLAFVQKRGPIFFSLPQNSIVDTFCLYLEWLKSKEIKFNPGIAYFTALLEYGMTVKKFPAIKEEVLSRMLVLEMPMVVELLTAEKPNIVTLRALAKKYNKTNLLLWLQKGFMNRRELLRQEVAEDPRNAYHRFYDFFSKEPLTHTYKSSMGTALHDAIALYIRKNSYLGAIEFVALLQLGVDKSAQDLYDRTVYDLAKDSKMFLSLLKEKAPTVETLRHWATTYLCEDSTDRVLEQLVDVLLIE